MIPSPPFSPRSLLNLALPNLHPSGLALTILGILVFTGCSSPKPGDSIQNNSKSTAQTASIPNAVETPVFESVKDELPVPAAREVDERTKATLLALNVDHPGLENFKASLSVGDYSASVRELAAYYRARKSPTWRTHSGRDPKVRYNKQVADNSAQGIIIGALVKVEYAFPNGNIDWVFNATKDNPDKSIAYNPEWQVQNNRMYFWQDLGNAYRATGDEKYARSFVAQMNDWIADCTLPTEVKNHAPSAWRTIEAGIRMSTSWPDSFFIFLQSPSFTDRDLVNFLGAIKDHATYLKAFYTNANWLTMEMAGLYTCGAMFPEFKDAKEWRSFSADLLSTEVARQFLPDGGHIELTAGYHVVAIDNFLAIIESARFGGFEQELPSAYLANLQKAYDYILTLRTPDGNIPCFNDSWPLPSSAIYTKAVGFFPQRADFKWALTNGKEGSRPSFTSKFLNRSGFAVMRSGWDKQDNYLVFDVGPLGYAHVHQDKLNLVLWAYGRELLFDGGGASYEASKWRTWSLSTAAHNTVLVDGLNQNIPMENDSEKRYQIPELVSQSDINARWISNEDFDYAIGTYNLGQGPDRKKIASHNREVLFLKPDLYLVADHLKPNDDRSHSYQARWHLMTTHTARNPKTKEVTTTDSGMANLAVVPLATAGLEVTTASAQETPEILGWNIRKDQYPMRTPATTVIHKVSGRGEQRFITLLLPLKPGESSPIQSISPGNSPVLKLRDGRQFKIKTAGGLGIAEISPDGKVIRSAQAPGR